MFSTEVAKGSHLRIIQNYYLSPFNYAELLLVTFELLSPDSLLYLHQLVQHGELSLLTLCA